MRAAPSDVTPGELAGGTRPRRTTSHHYPKHGIQLLARVDAASEPLLGAGDEFL